MVKHIIIDLSLNRTTNLHPSLTFSQVLLIASRFRRPTALILLTIHGSEYLIGYFLSIFVIHFFPDNIFDGVCGRFGHMSNQSYHQIEHNDKGKLSITDSPLVSIIVVVSNRLFILFVRPLHHV